MLTNEELILSTPEKAHRLEKEGRWADAAQMWKRMSRVKGDYYWEHAEACELIVTSTAQGDEYRRRVLEHAGPEPEVMGPKEDSIKWMQWYNKMSEVYTLMFRS